MKQVDLDRILNVLIKAADEHPEIIPAMVQSTERLHCLMIIMATSYMLHDGEREVAQGFLQACKDDFLSELTKNLDINLQLNGLSLEETVNEKTSREILASFKDAE